MSDNGHKPNGSANKKTGKTIKVGKKKIRIRKAIKKPAAPSREASLSSASGSSSASNMQKKKRLKKILIGALCVIAVGFAVGVGFIVTWMIDTPSISADDFTYTSATMVYDINGNPYQELQTAETRIPVSIDEVPEMVQLAFVSIEDQRFYAHHGVDIRGTVKAVFSMLFSGSTDGPGGSTITQQLIKQTVLTSEVSIERKVKEWKLAVEIESKMTKSEILEAYLNQCNMSITWGIESAAQDYFGESVDQLSVAQAAVLASIINSPTYYNPYVYAEDENGNRYLVTTTDANGNTVISYDPDNLERALLVIQKMHQLGHINDQEYEIAKSQLENNLIGLLYPTDTSTYTYFTDAVYTQVLNDIMTQYNYTHDAAENLLLNGGLKIYSTVDPDVQTALEQQAADDGNFPSQSSAAAAASAAVTAATGEPTNYIPQLGGVVIQNKTGYVVGIIGGREKTGSLTMNRALQSFQIGSTTKPLTVYAPGINEGIFTLASTFDNEPLNFGSWSIVNTPATYTGMTSVRYALSHSINIVAVLAQQKVGVTISADYGERFGLTITTSGTANDMNGAALALGGYTYGQTPLAVADAYTTFPNGGYRITPTFYTKVEDVNGNVILEADQKTVQVIKDSTAFLVTQALIDVVHGGTTTRSVPGQVIGGKTGTTDSNACTWFTGFTSEYTGSFWWGYDENHVSVNGTTYDLYIGMGGGGTDSPAQYWEKVFRQFYASKNLPNATLQSAPSTVFSAAVDSVSGLAPTELTAQDPRGSAVVSEYFADGTYPTASDNMHVLVTICNETGLIANQYCTDTTTKVMIAKDTATLWNGATLRNAGFVPASEAGFIAPTQTCTVHTAETALSAITGFEFSTEYDTNVIVSSLSLDSGLTDMLYLKTVAPSGTKNLTTETPTYVSSDPLVATVTQSSNGILVTAVGPGTATITATYTYSTAKTLSRTIEITVTN